MTYNSFHLNRFFFERTDKQYGFFSPSDVKKCCFLCFASNPFILGPNCALHLLINDAINKENRKGRKVA